MKNEFRLGNDLRTYDSLLDGISFDDLILQLHCNIQKRNITPDTVRSELHNMIEQCLVDAWFLVDKNMGKIIEYARDYYRDE